eukprot:scaffold4545_cov103-Alexandrium_tamarense.AAC.8
MTITTDNADLETDLGGGLGGDSVPSPSAPHASSASSSNPSMVMEQSTNSDGSLSVKVTKTTSPPNGYHNATIEHYHIPSSMVNTVRTSLDATGEPPSSLYLTRTEETSTLPPNVGFVGGAVATNSSLPAVYPTPGEDQLAIVRPRRGNTVVSISYGCVRPTEREEDGSQSYKRLLRLAGNIPPGWALLDAPRSRFSTSGFVFVGGGLNGTLKNVFENSIFLLHLCQPSTSPFLASLSLHLSSGATLLPGSHHLIAEKCLLGSATRYRERVLLHDYDVMFSCHRRCTIQSSIVKLLDTRAFVC